jgi:signal transduction histidine kinase
MPPLMGDDRTLPTVGAPRGVRIGGRPRPPPPKVADGCDSRSMPATRQSISVCRMKLMLVRVRSLPVLDVVVAVALLIAGVLEALVPFHTSLGSGSKAVAALLCVAMTIPLAVRRVTPIGAAFAVCIPGAIVAAVTDVRLLFFGGFLPLLLVVYTLAVHARSRAAVALPFATLVVVELEVPAFRKPGEIVFDWLWFAVAAAVGFVVRSRSTRAERSESRVAALESERASVLREERARIARELHDVIAHSVSVIVVQAGAAEPLVTEDPEQARAALRSIRSAGSDALGEMRRLLGILREHGDEIGRAPQPSVSAIEPLLDQAAAAGIAVTLHVEGERRTLAPGVDLAAYRIVQEALTNTRKHAAAGRADVTLRYGPASLEVEVVDDGIAEDMTTNGSGHGLVGMRERAALYGGVLEAGTRPGGGFAIRAVLPAA